MTTVRPPTRPMCGKCGWPIGDTTDPAYAGCYPDQCTAPEARVHSLPPSQRVTEKQLLLEMLRRAQIEYTEMDARHVEVVRGYSGFYTYFEFDAEGRLVDMGASEG